MHKSLKKIGLCCSFCLVVGLMSLSLGVSKAYAIRPTSNHDYEDWNPKDPASWSQNLDGNPNHLCPPNKKGAKGVMYDGSGRFTADACMIFSYTFIMLKSGAEEIGFTPADAHDKLYNTMKPYGWTDYGALTDSDMNGVMTCDNSHISQKTSDDEIKRVWDSGKLLILIVPIGGGTHAIVVDKIEGDDIYVLDSGNWGTKLSDHYGKNACLGYASFTMKDGTKSSELPVVQEHPDGNLGGKSKKSSDTLTSEQKSYNGGGGFWTPDESKIPNMPTYREYLEKQSKSGGESNYHDFITKMEKAELDEDFQTGNSGAVSIERWKDERQRSEEKDIIAFLRIVVMVLSFLMVGYALVFVCAFLIDKLSTSANGAIFNLIGFLTFGKMRYMSLESVGDMDAFDGVGFKPVTDKNIAVLLFILLIFPSLMLSGIGYELISMLWDLVMGIIEYSKGLLSR